jgi:hypothetical protein
MKKTILILMLAFASMKLNAQTDTIALYQMNKVQLAQIYLTEVNRVVKSIPVVTFDSGMVDVPKSKYLSKKFKDVSAKVKAYQKALLIDYTEIIPYADKVELINAIAYLKGL